MPPGGRRIAAADRRRDRVHRTVHRRNVLTPLSGPGGAGVRAAAPRVAFRVVCSASVAGLVRSSQRLQCHWCLLASPNFSKLVTRPLACATAV
jgi:hypothetical protein